MSRHRIPPETNAGSMADIAFLILIFFLVATTIETNAGIDRKLPPKEATPPIPFREKNILRIVLNKNNEVMVENELVYIAQLKDLVMDFLDNGGISKGEKGFCGYCKGNGNEKSSDNPEKAIISLTGDRMAKYAVYVSIQDQLNEAYHTLRNREAQQLFGINYTQMESDYYSQETSEVEKKALKDKIERIRDRFPLKISEAQTVFK